MEVNFAMRLTSADHTDVFSEFCGDERCKVATKCESIIGEIFEAVFDASK